MSKKYFPKNLKIYQLEPIDLWDLNNFKILVDGKCINKGSGTFSNYVYKINKEQKDDRD